MSSEITKRELQAALSLLGWAEPVDGDADWDLAGIVPPGVLPISITNVLRLIDDRSKSDDNAAAKQVQTIPFESPVAPALARAARNGRESIPADVEARMREDKEWARKRKTV